MVCVQPPSVVKSMLSNKNADTSSEDSDEEHTHVADLHPHADAESHAFGMRDRRGRSAAHLVCDNKAATQELLSFVLGKEFIPKVPGLYVAMLPLDKHAW